jgi:radical SAM superfamily enzyme
MVSKYRINHCWVFSVQQKKNTKQVNFMFYFQNLKNTYANDTRLCLFFEINFLKNYFSNFLIFVYH